MGKVLPFLADKLVNALSGTGTSRDVRQANAYVSLPLTQQGIATAYSGSGLMRKIIQIPALDMVREWRNWDGVDDDQAAAIFDEEKRLCLRQKARQVEVLRGMGGGALILGLPGNPDEPAPDSIAKGKLAFIHVVSRWHLTFDKLQDDATAQGYGEPVMWKMNTEGGTQQPIHPSRVVPFRADTSSALAMPSTWGMEHAFWGESTVQQVLDAVQDSDMARASFAALINKARLLRLGIPGLMDLASTEGGEAKIQKRMSAVVLAESIHNATIYDAGDPETGKGGETITDTTYTFAGAKDVLEAYSQFVAAVSDIPMTRMHGQSARGMNSSGDSEQKDWNKKIRAKQTLELGPCMERVDKFLLQSAGAKDATTASYDWAPLDTPTEKERADAFWLFAQATEKIAGLQVVPDQAFNRGVQSALVEGGYYPELEAALAGLSDEERYGIVASLAEVGDPNLAEGGDPASAGGSGAEVVPLRRAANDATPRSLYVSRKLLNGAEFIRWAKDQGFETTVPADELHVPVLYSRQPVDWMQMGSTWDQNDKGELVVPPGGARVVEPLGDKGAVVLLFNSSELSWRHEDMVRQGASHDFAEYQPHVTINYSGAGVDLAKVEPYRGELRFGPEIFEEVNDDWAAGVSEEG